MNTPEKTQSCSQSDDMLKGRIIAMRSMIAQFENEIKQLESNLKLRECNKKQTSKTFNQRFVECMEEFVFQIKDDVLREQTEAALTHLRGVFASDGI